MTSIKSSASGAIVGILALTSTANADIPPQLEAGYSNAVIAFKTRDYPSAQKLIAELLAQSPKQIEFLELQALISKSQKAEDQAIATYQTLVALRNAEGPGATAPYHFELGTLAYRRKNYPLAVKEFRQCLESGFNRSGSHFFLGIVASQQKDWSLARRELELFDKSPVAELRPTASFFLGQAYTMSKYYLAANESYFDARQSARAAQLDADTSEELRAGAAQIVDGSEKALKPFAAPHVFGSVALTGGYDSNVMNQPGSSANQASGKSSPEFIISGDVGYSSSALNTWQWTPSYRFNINLATNSQSAAGDFATNMASLLLTHNALARTSWGIKLEGLYVFNNMYDADANSHKFRPYMMSGALSPFLRTRLSSSWTWAVELSGLYQSYVLDSSTTDPLKQSGPDLRLKSTFRRTEPGHFWNPSAYVGMEYDYTSGVQFRDFSPGMGVSNMIRFNDANQASAELTLDLPNYAVADPYRFDKTLGFNLGGTHLFSRSWSALLKLSYGQNFSNGKTNTDNFAYSRWTLYGGASWSI